MYSNYDLDPRVSQMFSHQGYFLSVHLVTVPSTIFDEGANLSKKRVD
jgi:hypothetical protein